MSLKVTRSELNRRFKECQTNQGITQCKDCHIYEKCCDYGAEVRVEAREAARQANGRFGLMYCVETVKGEKKNECLSKNP